MKRKVTVINSGYFRYMIIIFLTLTASMLPEVIFREWFGSVPPTLPFGRLMLLIAAAILSQYLSQKNLTKFIIVLGAIVLAEIITGLMFESALWQATFDEKSFVGIFGGSILLKIIGIIPVIGILLAFFKHPEAVYLCKGDLSIKADAISWLGIKANTISWGKLAVISAFLIPFGTILLTVLTVTGSADLKTDTLLKHVPFVVIFAVINSFCEGIVYRSAILGSVKEVLPKDQAIFIAALIFGIGHYYGAPRGILGVVMSFLLGWYLSRSMYETKGLVSSWIIHAMQDAVIFTTILLLGNYY